MATTTEFREPSSFTALEIRELRLEDLERFARSGKKLALREWLAKSGAAEVSTASTRPRPNCRSTTSGEPSRSRAMVCVVDSGPGRQPSRGAR